MSSTSCVPYRSSRYVSRGWSFLLRQPDPNGRLALRLTQASRVVACRLRAPATYDHPVVTDHALPGLVPPRLSLEHRVRLSDRLLLVAAGAELGALDPHFPPSASAGVMRLRPSGTRSHADVPPPARAPRTCSSPQPLEPPGSEAPSAPRL